MEWRKASLFTLVLFLALLVIGGVTGCSETSIKTTTRATTPTTTTPAKPSIPPGGAFSDNRTPPSLDWVTAAAKLGITEEKLRQALENTGQGMFDMSQAAVTLGVSEEVLRDALGFPQGEPGEPKIGPRPTGIPPSDVTPIPPPDEINKTST